jgi:hypothetical protein
MPRRWELAAIAPDIGKNPVTALLLQRLQRFGQDLAVVHYATPILPFGKYAVSAPLVPTRNLYLKLF